MKIYDILPKITDVKLYFEIKENDSGASFGFFTKNELEKSGVNTGAPKIEGLKATFTAPGQSVTYSFYTKNAGALKAYLTSVNFAEVSTGVTKTCTAKSVQSPATLATDSLVQAACSGISLTVSLGPTGSAESFTSTTARSSFTTATAHDLNADAYEQVVVVIAYAANSAQADGDFDVTFGDVTLNYSSVAS